MNKIYTVIEFILDGKIVYLRSPWCTSGEPPVEDPLEAKDYTNCPEDLTRDLANLHIPGDGSFAKSSYQTQSIPMIRVFELALKPVSSRIARLPRED